MKCVVATKTCNELLSTVPVIPKDMDPKPGIRCDHHIGPFWDPVTILNMALPPSSNARDGAPSETVWRRSSTGQ